MKGHCINLGGQLVCIFPFTNATEFERMAHNGLPAHALVYDDGKDYEPFSIERANDDVTVNYYGFCFVSYPLNAFVSQNYCIISKSDRGALANLALENDAWADEQVKIEEDEGPEREFNVTVLENWKMVVSYKVMATSKQDAKDRITSQEVDFYHKELIEEDYVEWKSVEEA